MLTRPNSTEEDFELGESVQEAINRVGGIIYRSDDRRKRSGNRAADGRRIPIDEVTGSGNGGQGDDRQSDG